MNNIGQLPSELLSVILSHVDATDLYTCTLVNHKFYEEAMPLLWRRPIIYSKESIVMFTTAVTLSPNAHGSHVQFISIRYAVSGTDILALLCQLPVLDHLELTQAHHISDIDLQHAFSHCPRLTALRMYHANATRRSMDCLAQSCPHLRKLTLGFCDMLDYNTLFSATSALRACPLEAIELSPSHSNDDDFDDFDDFDDDDSDDDNNDRPVAATELFRPSLALDLHHYAPQLTSLAFRQYDGYNHTPFLTALCTRGLTWPRLTHIDLEGFLFLDDAMVMAFLQAHPGLQSVKLNHCRITDRTLDCIAFHLPYIQEIQVDYCGEVTTAGIIDLLRRLSSCRGERKRLERGISCGACDVYDEDADFLKADLNELAYGRGFKWQEGRGYDATWIAGNALDH